MNSLDIILDIDNKYESLSLLCILLKDKIDNFNYEGNYEELDDIFMYISNLIRRIKSKSSLEKAYKILEETRIKIQQLLIQKPGNIKKDNKNYIFLKKVINNIESLQISFLSDYINKYEGNSYEFIEFLLFSVKNYPLIEIAVRKYPYIVNYQDEKSNNFIYRIVDEYINSILKYTKGKRINDNSDILYYNKLLKLFIEQEKNKYTVLMEKENIKKIKDVIDNIDYNQYNDLTKRKLFFWLNELEMVLEKNIQDDDYTKFKYKYDIKDKFDEGVKSSSIIIERKFKKDYTNSRNNRYMITIDDKDAEEIDDGLSIELLENGNYSFGVHIADPSSIIDFNSIIMDEARKRTTSIYLSNQTISMFPEILSKGILSLNENFQVPVTSYYYELTPNGEVVREEYIKEYMKSNRKTTYKYVDKCLNDEKLMENEEEKFITSLILLERLTNILKEQIHMRDDYAKIKRTTSNPSKTNIIEHNSKSSTIVETSMIFNNYRLAKYMYENNFPFVYRCHNIDQNYIDKLNHYKETLSKEELKNYIDVIKAYYPSAYYSITNRGHNGLGLKYYAHTTSPLRRFADIICNECLKKFYFEKEIEDKEVYKFEKMLKQECSNINSKNKKAETFTNEYEKNYAKSLILR